MMFCFGGTVRSEGDKYIPWILNKDTDVVIQVAEPGKSPTCISEMACQAAQRQGLTEMTLVDHSLTQRVQDLIESCLVNITLHVLEGAFVHEV